MNIFTNTSFKGLKSLIDLRLLVFVVLMIAVLMVTLRSTRQTQQLATEATSISCGMIPIESCDTLLCEVKSTYTDVNCTGSNKRFCNRTQGCEPQSDTAGLYTGCVGYYQKLVSQSCVRRTTPYPLVTAGASQQPSPPPTSPVSNEPVPTTSQPDYGERCRVKGRVEYFDNLNLRNASNVIQWNSGGPQDISTNADGVYSIDKRYSNVWDTFELKVNNPYLTYRTFAVKGAVPNGCSVINNGTTIRCNKSVCYERNSDLISFNFEEIAPSRPNSKISNVNNLTYGQTLTWTVEATDADSNLQSTGVYLHSGTPAVGEAQGWTVLKWVGGQKTSSLTYRHNDATGVRAQFVCDASKVGTWTIATNAVDTTGLNCSGNPVSGEIWCASHPNDRKTFTCAAPINTPRAEISYPAWGASWSVGQMNNDPNLSKIIVAAKGDPNKQYDVIAYIHKIPFSASANAWSIATTSWTCDNTYGKWAELSRISVPKGRLNSSTGTTITLPAIDWGKVISQGGLNPQPGFRYLINVNIVSTTFREDGLDTSVCTGSPAKDPATGKACFSSNWCNFDKSRGTGNMFKIITLNP